MATPLRRRGLWLGRNPSPLLHLAVTAVALALSGCASLPTSGPTVQQIVKEAKSNKNVMPFALLPLDAEAVRNAKPLADPGIAKLTMLAQDKGPERADMILPGDSLNISVFEIGIGLFGGGAVAPASPTPRPPSAGAQILTTDVREDGFVTLPYVGRIRAAGAYPEELAEVIRRHLKPFSENPEVDVAIAGSVKNVVYLGGVVAKSGRYRLTAAHERLLDALALAGGSTVDPNELEVRLQRGSQEAAAPLSRISPGDSADITIHPGDRIQFVRVRPSYTVFGASDKINQIFFEAKDVTLAEAIARAAGPSDARANPRGVFLCRYETGPDGQPRPVVYRLDMMKTEAYFLAQKFPMRDKDVILFANSSGTMTQKLVGLISNLFSPAVAVGYAVK